MNQLLIKTKDNRKFVTNEKNEPSAIELAKTFNAEIYQINLIEGKVLDLKPLAKAFCSPDYCAEPIFKTIKKIYPATTKAGKKTEKIRKFIEQKMRSGKDLSMKDLKAKYNASDSCLSILYSEVRKTFVDEGQKIEKLGAGRYRLIQ